MDNNNLKNINKQVEGYADFQGNSIKKFNFGLWFIKNKHNLLLMITWVLIFSAIIFWVYFLYNFFSYVFFGIKEDESVLKDLTVYNLSLEKEAYIKNIEFNFVKAIPSDKNNNNDNNIEYDLIGVVKNFNVNVVAEMDYRFIINGEKTEPKKAFVFPGEEKYLVSFGEKIADNFYSGSGEIFLENIIFKKINRHNIPDFKKFSDERLNFVVSDVKFLEAQESGLSSNLSFNDLSFYIINETPFGYYQPKFLIFLIDQRGEILSARQYFLNKFLSREKRLIQISWPGEFLNVNKIDVIPDIDILNSEVYLNPNF